MFIRVQMFENCNGRGIHFSIVAWKLFVFLNNVYIIYCSHVVKKDLISFTFV